MNTMRLDGLINFLERKKIKNPMWHKDLEVQLNVSAEGGVRVDGQFMGHSFHEYTDGINKWKGFRIPYNAKTEPEYEDKKLTFSLDHHAEGIGSTGWNWKTRQSEWVGFDFDSIIGHKKGISETEIDEIIERVKVIPWSTIKRSTGGRGIHIFINFSPFIDTKNHTEHKAVARCVLNYLSAMARFDFSGKIDCYGGIMWLWHGRAEKIISSKLDAGLYKDLDELYEKEDFLPFKVIKQGEHLSNIPGLSNNLSEQIEIVSSRKHRPMEHNSRFNLLASTTQHTQLDDDHRKLMKWLEDNKKLWWWDSDNHMLVCHTFDLQTAHRELCFRGIFHTDSSGKNSGNDQNCFGFPLQYGSWIFRRHGHGTKEHSYWEVDNSGWTKAYFNRLPSISSAMRTFGGLVGSKGDYEFHTATKMAEAINALGLRLEVPSILPHRRSWIKPAKGNCLIVTIERTKGDPDVIEGWRRERNTWATVIRYKQQSDDTDAPDEKIRQVILMGQHEGWYYKDERNVWTRQPKGNIEAALKAEGLQTTEVPLVMGKAIKKPWEIVSEPFQPEYLGDRKWNKESAQLAFKPLRAIEGTPTWDAVLNHIGANLTPHVLRNEWCKRHSVINGADWLRLWIACLIQYPTSPLPYIFLYSHEQETGKSTLHEAIAKLFKDRTGFCRADQALTSSSNFNGELRKAILAVIEETDLNSSKSASERIKDWVTSEYISIHPKGGQPYMVLNTTHWIQCANDESFAPITQGDTRIVMVKVNKLPHQIPRDILHAKLEVEAPGFLHQILNMEIPTYIGRLKIPVIETTDKHVIQQRNNKSLLEEFMEMYLYPIPGALIPFKELVEKFRKTLSMEEKTYWHKNRIAREFPVNVVKGKWGQESNVYIANNHWEKHHKPQMPGNWYVNAAGRLIK